jgi:hypothetical protein
MIAITVHVVPRSGLGHPIQGGLIFTQLWIWRLSREASLSLAR